MTVPTEPRDILTQDEAVERARNVSDVRYTIALDIRERAGTYRGDVTVSFAFSGKGDTFLDFRGKEISGLEVNGVAVEPNWTGYRLSLPADLLREANTVRVQYENFYDHTGDGFHQFIDPEDREEYLYTNFEPYEAHRLFPCFDQPDLKGRYTLTVTAPASWELVANTREERTEPADDGRATRYFPQTAPFSTYLFALIAGPYAAVRDEHEGIPLGLFCRKSMLKYLDHDEVFEITKQGLSFFGEFFDYPYAFGKYDQVFVPEFNAGAMENVGAVTHHESMVYRDPPTENQRRRRAEVILHEMAHMWFGNLVTMRWWNDLWLNESFATFMAYLAMEKATRFHTAWTDFASSIKNWAYRQDQLVTTHPIAGVVRDTDETFLNFDGITYGKGASVIKQLVSAIGMDGFREGMRHYFRTHDYGNARLAEFLAALEHGSKRDLGEWSKKWLETASLNTVAANWSAEDGRLASLSLRQTAPPDYPTIRPHHLEIGILAETPEGFSTSVIPVDIDGPLTDIPVPAGTPAPVLVFPNFNDHGYAKVALDDASVAFVLDRLDTIDDSLLRLQLWGSLWNMVRDQQLKAPTFLDLVRSKIALEANLELVDAILGQASAALGRYVPDDRREEQAHLLFETARNALEAAPPGDAKIIWARTLINVALAPEDLQFIGDLADGRERFDGLTLDQDMRWSIATRHVAFDLPGANDRAEQEHIRDNSDRGERAMLRIATSHPDEKVKAGAWERFLGDGYGSLHLTGAAMSGFNWTHQAELLEPYVDRFFEAAPDVFRQREREFSSMFFGALFPGYRVERPILERSQRLLGDVSDSMPVLARMLREANDDLERAIKCREFAAS